MFVLEFNKSVSLKSYVLSYFIIGGDTEIVCHQNRFIPCNIHTMAIIHNYLPHEFP